jgi:hypothetical protein
MIGINAPFISSREWVCEIRKMKSHRCLIERPQTCGACLRAAHQSPKPSLASLATEGVLNEISDGSFYGAAPL